jgi:hypothetical protein
MRIEGYPPFAPPVSPSNRTAGTPLASASQENLTPQERLAKLLDEKRWMGEAAFNENPSGELGQHIDLRV